MLTMAPYTLEVCVDSMASARAAAEGGASRIELCASLLEGGLTPSAGMIELAQARLPLDIMVMIRPRGGDFLYTDDEFAIMQRDIDIAKAHGVRGVVFGILTAHGEIDQRRCAALIDRARPLAVTFHRAFDMVADPQRALDALIALGVDRVLTSGMAPDALQGAANIAALVKQAGGRIIVMPGGGVNDGNITAVARATGAQELHMSGRVVVDSAMQHRNLRVRLGGTPDAPDYALHVTSAARVRASIDALRAL